MLIKYKFLLVIYLAKTWTLVLQSNKSCYSNDNSKHKCFNPTTNTNKMDTSFTEDKGVPAMSGPANIIAVKKSV